MKYFAYTRKSTEEAERQALSIQSQIDEIQNRFPQLEVVKVFQESASAYEPENRPMFAEMIQRIKNGEAQGLIAWHPDRLSRNELDAGMITHLVRKEVIADLKFCSYTFQNSAEGIMMLQFALSQSQYSSSKLSTDVKRGINQKISLGWFPGPARVGYLNTPEMLKGTRIIVKDPERFDLVRKMWDLLLTGAYSVPQIARIANEEWGFRTRKSKRGNIGNSPISKSSLYDVFSSVFYAGLLSIKGEIYQGSHEPMITLEEYDRAQALLGRRGRPRPKAHRFAYTGLIQCGECGCSIIAEQKAKQLKTNNETRLYTYYHCSWKRPCSQRKSVREEILEEQIKGELTAVTILPEFRQWALEALKEANDVEIEERSKIHISLSAAAVTAQHQLDNLTRMRFRDLIDDDQFQRSQRELREKLTGLKERLRASEDRAESWFNTAEKVFDFAANAGRQV